MTQATIAKLSAWHKPWAYSLRFHAMDNGTYHRVIAMLRGNLPDGRCKYDSRSRTWLVRAGDEVVLADILRNVGATFDEADYSR